MNRLAQNPCLHIGAVLDMHELSSACLPYSKLFRVGESQIFIWRPEILTVMIVIDVEMCVGCGHCVPFCSVEALSVFGKAEVDYELCIECLTCIEYCPNQAIKGDEE